MGDARLDLVVRAHFVKMQKNLVFWPCFSMTDGKWAMGDCRIFESMSKLVYLSSHKWSQWYELSPFGLGCLSVSVENPKICGIGSCFSMLQVSVPTGDYSIFNTISKLVYLNSLSLSCWCESCLFVLGRSRALLVAI